MIEKPKVIGIIGGTFSGNRGAESMLVTCIGVIKREYPTARFKVFSYYPKQDRELVQDPEIQIVSCKPQALVLRFLPFALLYWLMKNLGNNVPRSLLSAPILHLLECDKLLDIGGVSFIDGREKFLPFNILTILPAILLKIPVIKLAQAMGPFHNPINRIAAKIMLPRCERIFARGDITLAHLNALNLANIHRATDVAFSYLPEFSLSIENEDLVSALEAKISRHREEGKTIVVVSPSSLVYEKSPQYLKRLTNLISSLAGENIRFLFLANSNLQWNNKPRNNDLVVLRALQEECKNSLSAEVYHSTDWAIWDSNTKSQRRLIAVGDLLITSRFHAMVSGLSLGLPVLVIGWSHKYQEVLSDFGFYENAVDFDQTENNLSEKAKQMLTNRIQISQSIATNLPRVQSESLRQFDFIHEI